ncbi:MAG: electron transfer flavoprotein subunit alpha/FixB family protein [Ignavibacteriaceae bacterium]
MSKIVLAILEQRENKLKKVSFEVLSFSKNVASKLNACPPAGVAEVTGIVIGNEIENLNEISKYGISKVLHFRNEALTNYSSTAYTDIITDAAKETDAEYLIFGDTALGKDLAPRVGARLDAGCIIDCVSVNLTGDTPTFTRPVYAGKALVDVKFNSDKKVVTIRPNVFTRQPGGLGEEIALSVETREVSNPNLKTKVIEYKKSEGKLDVAEADIIVSGGRGLKAPENFNLIENLAEALGAAVGASRAAVDAGWRPHREQVGQTGKTVSPSLYVACGISGAIQHLAGMSSSKYIVAINKDKDAPIFSIADYGIVGDVFEILPVLTEEIKKVRL